jgi:predicted DNA-binding WGR domain protein
MAKRYFLCQDNGSNKFWNISVVCDHESEEYTLTVRHLRKGRYGQITEKEFDSAEECEKEANKLIAQKIKKGYVESKEIDLQSFMGATKADENLFSDESIQKIETALGYKIPQAYINLMQIKNGDEEWRKIGDDLLDMTGFDGIDNLQEMKELRIEEWGYPNVGIYFAWTESGGHEALLLNYKECFIENEPSVWLVDLELETAVFLAKNFEEFIKQLYFEDFTEREKIEKTLEDWGWTP